MFNLISFLGLLLVTATAFPTSEGLIEGFRTGGGPNKPKPAASRQNGGRLERSLKKMEKLRKEMCTIHVECTDNYRVLLTNNLNLPQLREQDGCFWTGYNWDNCLLRLTSSFQEFQVYMEHMQNKFPTPEANRISRDMYNRTRTLTRILKAEVKKTGKAVPISTANPALLGELLSQNEKQKLLVMERILYSLKDFVQFGVRATRQHYSSS